MGLVVFFPKMPLFSDLKVLFILCFIRLRFCLQSCLWPWDQRRALEPLDYQLQVVKNLLCAGNLTRVL